MMIWWCSPAEQGGSLVKLTCNQQQKSKKDRPNLDEVEFKLFIKLYFLLFNSSAVPLGKKTSKLLNLNHKHGTYIKQHTAPSTLLRNTQSTVERSSETMRVTVMTDTSTKDCPSSFTWKQRCKKKKKGKKNKQTALSVGENKHREVYDHLISSYSVSFPSTGSSGHMVTAASTEEGSSIVESSTSHKHYIQFGGAPEKP